MSDTDGIQSYMLALANKDDPRLYEKHLLSSAKEGYIPAKLALADLYREKNISKAIGWYKELSDQGMDYAMYRLGECYLSENDFKQGMFWLRRSSQSGNVEAMYELHSRSADDTENMRTWFSHYAGIYDYTNAWRILNIMDENTAEESWTAMVRISSDNPQRMINEVDSCIEIYLKDDPVRRFLWHKRCSDIGDADSMLEIGRMYQYGIGTERSPTDALEFYKKAAELDNYRAMYCIGRMYQTGAGVIRSAEEARKWFSRIPEIDYPLAEYRMAELDGIKDIFDELGTDFIDLLELFAKGNDAESQYYLGMFYHWLFSYDEMTLDNIDRKAMRLYLRSAENGYPRAQVLLGKLYESGSGGMERSNEKALGWYLKAADMDDPEGMYLAAMLYKNGSVSDASEEKAEALFRKASEYEGFKELCQKELGSLHQ